MITVDYRELPLSDLGKTIITIGNFDGVHAGHQELIRRTILDAHQNNLRSIVVTFDPHPAAFFRPNHIPLTICSNEYKMRFIEAMGVDAMLILTFDKSLATLEAEDYVREIVLDKLNARIIWVGYDFSFGRNRSGNARTLIALGEKFHFKTNVLNPQRVDNIIVSSTKVRELILSGKVEQAARLLNRNHIITGRVITGDGLGRKLGFPTINIHVDDGLIPGAGIFSGIARVNGDDYPAAIYIGHRPTLAKTEFRVEAHLPGFSGNLYYSQVTLAFLKFIRTDIKFQDFSDLINKIQQDCEITIQDFSSYKNNNSQIPIFW